MEYDFEKAGLYPATWHAFKQNFPLFALIAGALFLLEVMAHFFPSKMIDWLVPTYLMILAAFHFHTSILYANHNETKSGPSRPFKRWHPVSPGDNTHVSFVWRSLVIFAVFVVILLVVALLFSSFLIGQGHLRSETAEISALTGAALGFIFYGVSFALFGTILPATVAKGDNSFSTTFIRGKKTFWYVFDRILIGSTAFFILSASILVGLAYLGVRVSVYDANGSWSFLGSLVSFPMYLAGIFITGLNATTLCKAYLRYEQRPEPTPDAV